MMLGLCVFTLSLNAQETCEITDPTQLPWVQDLLDVSFYCECGFELQYRCYNGEGIMVLQPNGTCLDVPTIIYDTEGNTLCSIGGLLGGVCPDYGDYYEADLLGLYSTCQGGNGCDIANPESLPWVEDLISNQNCPCNETLEYRCYNGQGIFVLGPTLPNNCADFPTTVYDGEGNVLCTIGGFIGSLCLQFPNIENNSTLISEVWACADQEPCICPAVYAPVCGVDGNTYSNSCVAACEGVEVASEGECGVENIACNFSWEFQYEIATADFPTSTASKAYCFTDNIFTDNICSWHWDFGSGNTSTSADPCEIGFPSIVNTVPVTTPYEVCLTVTECGSNQTYTCCKDLYVNNPVDGFCGVADPLTLPWLQTYINPIGGFGGGNDCYQNIYAFELNGQEVIYVQVDQVCLAFDVGSVLFDCNGNAICNDGGFTPQENQCSFQGIDVSPFLTAANLIWTADEPCVCTLQYDPVCGVNGQTYSNACFAACAGVEVASLGECGSGEGFCGVEDISELPWLQSYVEDCFYDEIYSFVINGQEAIYVAVDPICQLPDGTFIEIADLGNVLFDCSGNTICLNGGFTFPEAQCGFQGYNVGPFLTPDNLIWSEGDPNPFENEITLAANIYLQGAYSNSTDGLMRDDLRAKGVIPTLEPYTNLTGFDHLGGGGGEQVQNNAFAVTGANAIVDWVMVEMRNPTSNQVMATRSALLQRDGDVVDVDGISALSFTLAEGDYKVCVRHRNHLGVVTLNALNFTANNTTACDFNSIPTFGDNTLAEMPFGKKAIWGGCSGANGEIAFQGPNNTPNAIFFEVVSAPENADVLANYIYNGTYSGTDLDMNGEIIYQGNLSDVNFVFFSILEHPGNTSSLANYIIYEQMP